MNVEISDDGAVRLIALDRPEKLNALNVPLARALREALEAAAGDADVRAVVLTGRGRAFCAGGDVDEMRAALPRAGELFARLTAHLHPAVMALATMPKPTIVALNGPVAGGGTGLALAGDLRYGGASAMLRSAHFKRGLVPAGGITWLLPRLVGLARAQEVLFGERTLDAPTMLRWGVLHRVVPDDDLLGAALAEARRLADGPTDAIATTKALLGDAAALEAALARERELNRASGNTAAAAEGIRAFLEKREARFWG